jgi:hypothetical protein
MESKSYHLASYFFVMIFLNWYLFSFGLFANIGFCLQLVWIIVHTLCDDVCNFEREKTMVAI